MGGWEISIEGVNQKIRENPRGEGKGGGKTKKQTNTINYSKNGRHGGGGGKMKRRKR